MRTIYYMPRHDKMWTAYEIGDWTLISNEETELQCKTGTIAWLLERGTLVYIGMV
jgi:hypothetical protein